LLNPKESCGGAVQLFSCTTNALHAYGCLEAAVPELLPPVMHVLPLAVQHVLPHGDELEFCNATGMQEQYSDLVGVLLAAGEQVVCSWPISSLFS
jgi:hypothetical protein